MSTWFKLMAGFTQHVTQSIFQNVQFKKTFAIVITYVCLSVAVVIYLFYKFHKKNVPDGIINNRTTLGHIKARLREDSKPNIYIYIYI